MRRLRPILHFGLWICLSTALSGSAALAWNSTGHKRPCSG